MHWTMMPSGVQFTFDPVDEDRIHLADICHNLAGIQRFCGSLKKFEWSVAQHSLFVADLVKTYVPRDTHLVKAALAHDFSEAYISDIPKPVKELLPDYRRLEDELTQKIHHRFNIAPLGLLFGTYLKAADSLACWMEAKTGGLHPEKWGWDAIEFIITDSTFGIEPWRLLRKIWVSYPDSRSAEERLYEVCRSVGMEG